MIFAFVLVQKNKQTNKAKFIAVWLSSIQIYSFKVFTHLLLVFSGWPRTIWWTGTGRLPWFTCKFFPFVFFFNHGGASFVLLQFLVSVASSWAGSDILLRSEARCNIYSPLQYALSVQMPDPSLTQWFPHLFIFLFIYFVCGCCLLRRSRYSRPLRPVPYSRQVRREVRKRHHHLSPRRICNVSSLRHLRNLTLLCLSAKQRRKPWTGSPSVYQDLNTRHD